MKISNKLERIKEEDALVLVAGKQNAVVYEIQDGEIERLDAVKVPRPRWADKEGYFKTRIGGRVVRSGAANEFEDRVVIDEFLRELEKWLKGYKGKPDKLYVLAPEKTKNLIPKHLPDTLKRKLAAVIEGNFYYRSPTFLVERINKELISR